MEEKSLINLADEYSENIKLTDSMIANCREALNKARKQHRNAIVSKLTSNLAVLYRQRSELVEIEQYLRRYYPSDREVKQAV